MSKKISNDDLNTWLSINNIIPEKSELYHDFIISLTNIIRDTYLGGDTGTGETRIILTYDDNLNHFRWCWLKTLSDFQKENIFFNKDGEHYNYFLSLYLEIYYTHNDSRLNNELINYFNGIFDIDKPYSKYELEVYTKIYKHLDKNLSR